MKTLVAENLCKQLKVMRNAAPDQSMPALATFYGLVTCMRFAGALDVDQYSRLLVLALNACRYSLIASCQNPVMKSGDKTSVGALFKTNSPRAALSAGPVANW